MSLAQQSKAKPKANPTTTFPFIHLHALRREKVDKEMHLVIDSELDWRVRVEVGGHHYEARRGAGPLLTGACGSKPLCPLLPQNCSATPDLETSSLSRAAPPLRSKGREVD